MLFWPAPFHFHRRVRVGSVCKGAARDAFPPSKVCVIRTEPYWAVLVWQYSSIWVLRRLKGCQQFRATHAVRWPTDYISVWIITNKHITREVFLDNGEALFIEENVTQKFAVLLGRPTLLLFVLFFLGFIRRLHCPAAVISRCLRSWL
jgi:hypothetical protein